MEAQPNPYAPPEAPVADFDPVPPGPCSHVELACRLLWISFGVSLLDTVVKIIRAPSLFAGIIGIVAALIGIGIGYVILSWITRKLRAGRNWMRWLYTVVNVLSWLSIPYFWNFYREAFRTMSGNWLAILSMFVSTVVGIAVLVLLHTHVTRDWFRARAAEA
jgi:hypothetical protein